MEVREKKYHCTLINPSAKGVVTNSVRTCPYYYVTSPWLVTYLLFCGSEIQVGRQVIKNKKKASSKKMHSCLNPNIA